MFLEGSGAQRFPLKQLLKAARDKRMPLSDAQLQTVSFGFDLVHLQGIAPR